MKEKRRHSRATGSWEVTVWRESGEHVAGQEWAGKSIDFSPGGLKVKFAGDLEPGARVTLIFKPPDGGPIISTVAAVVRKDPAGHAFAFASLPYADFVRLKKMVKART